MTETEIEEEVDCMKAILLRAMKRHNPGGNAGLIFWVLLDMAVQSGLILFGREQCLERMCGVINYLIQRHEKDNQA